MEWKMPSTTKYQYSAALTVNLLTVAYGSSVGWSSSSFLILKSKESPLDDGPLNDFQLSWINSLLCLGAVVGTLSCGFLTNIVGRKNSLCGLAIPQLISWILIMFATDADFLYLARFLAGFTGGGVCVVVPLLVAEISEDKIRGELGSFTTLALNAGILCGFVAGYLLSFAIVPICLIIIPAIFLLLFVFYPETPVYLLRKLQIQNAENSLRFYRNIKNPTQQNAEILQNELAKLQLNAKSSAAGNSAISLADFKAKSTRKAFLIGIVLIFLHEFCGCFVMLNYAASIFAESGSNISPNMAAIIVGLIQLIGSYVSTFLVDRIGRKILISVSSIGTGLSLSVFGIYTYLKSLDENFHNFQWIPVVAFSLMIFIASCGVLPLHFVIISEIMPEKLRCFGQTLCMTLSWVLAFLLILSFSTFLHLIGLHGCILFFALSCYAGAAFVIFCLPETKGKSFAEIVQMLEK